MRMMVAGVRRPRLMMVALSRRCTGVLGTIPSGPGGRVKIAPPTVPFLAGHQHGGKRQHDQYASGQDNQG
jgi:hypothetical protein